MQPYNYQINVASPIESAVQGLRFGAGLADMQAARQAQALQMQQAQQAMEQQRAAQQAIAAFYSKPNKTTQDYEAVGAYMPADKMRAMTEQFKMGNEKANQDMLGFTQQALAAVENGNVPVALDLIRQRAESAKNSDKQEEAQALDTWGKLIGTAPEKASDTIMALVAGLPGGKDVIESIMKIRTERRAQELQPSALLKASNDALKAESEAKIKQIEANLAPKKLAADLGFVLAQTDQSRAAASSSRAAAAASGAAAERARAESRQINAGIIPADKRPEAEAKFRKEYSDQTKMYQDVKASYGRVNASESSAVGDLSLIFGYMKMLDPGSVVREGEFATAQNAAGIDDRTINLYNRIINGERLSESQRKAFKGQAKKLYEKAAEQEKSVRSGIERIAKGYGLNPENIFYETTPKDEAAQPADQPAQSIDALLKKYGGK